MKSPLHASIEPSFITNCPNGERLTLTLSLHNNFRSEASVVYGVEFVDDTGAEVTAPSIMPTQAMASGTDHNFTIDTPSKLNDGFYMLRVHVAAKNGNQAATHELEEYLQVENGKLYVVDSGTYFGESRANVGVLR